MWGRQRPSAFSHLPRLSFGTPTGRSLWVTQGRGTSEHSPGWSSAGGRGLLQTNQRQPAVAAALRPQNAASLRTGDFTSAALRQAPRPAPAFWPVPSLPLALRPEADTAGSPPGDKQAEDCGAGSPPRINVYLKRILGARSQDRNQCGVSPAHREGRGLALRPPRAGPVTSGG